MWGLDMKIKYPELIGKCKTCELGCQRLEDINFKGVFRCQYYIERCKEEDGNTNRNWRVCKN